MQLEADVTISYNCCTWNASVNCKGNIKASILFTNPSKGWLSFNSKAVPPKSKSYWPSLSSLSILTRIISSCHHGTPNYYYWSPPTKAWDSLCFYLRQFFLEGLQYIIHGTLAVFTRGHTYNCFSMDSNIPRLHSEFRDANWVAHGLCIHLWQKSASKHQGYLSAYINVLK